MIRIKAPRVWRLNPMSRGIEPSHYNKCRMGGEPGRWISEPMHRRVVALVRAVEDAHDCVAFRLDWPSIRDEYERLLAQAEKEAK